MSGAAIQTSRTRPRPSGKGAAASRLARWFCVSAAAILLLAGLAKVLSALGSSRAFDMVDPVLGLKLRRLFVAVGLLELGTALLVLTTGAHLPTKLLLVAWLSSSFLIYRSGPWLIDWHRPCSCLGTLTDFLHISPTAAGWSVKVALGYLLASSCASLRTERCEGSVFCR